MATTVIGFGVDEVEVYAQLVGVDTRPAVMRRALAEAAARGVPFGAAWGACSSYFMAHRDGAWEPTLRTTKEHWRASYERNLARWAELTAEGRERQSVEWTRLPAETRERLAA